MITRTDILAHLERGIRVGFTVGMKAYSPLRSNFVQEKVSDGAFETYADMGAVPWPEAGSGLAGSGGTDTRTGAEITGGISEGGPITILGGEERSHIVYNRDWYVAIGIQHSAINDNRTGDLEQWARNAAVRFQQHMDFLAFDALNSGEAATNYGKTYDGLTLFSDAHIDKGAQYQTGQDNKYALTLTLDNFETVKVAASKFKDGRGQPVGLNHRLLIVPPELERVAAQITKNEAVYNTANREMNPYAGTTRYIVAPGGWMDATAWYLVDDSMPEKPVVFQTRQQPQLAVWDDHTQGSGVRYFKWLARYTVAYGDWRLIAQGNT